MSRKQQREVLDALATLQYSIEQSIQNHTGHDPQAIVGLLYDELSLNGQDVEDVYELSDLKELPSPVGLLIYDLKEKAVVGGAASDSLPFPAGVVVNAGTDDRPTLVVIPGADIDVEAIKAQIIYGSYSYDGKLYGFSRNKDSFTSFEYE